MLEGNQYQSAKTKSNQKVINDLCLDASNLDMNELAELYKQCYKSATGVPMQKYKKEDNVWSGRGRMPAWVREHLDLGGQLDDILSPVAMYHKMMQLKTA